MNLFKSLVFNFPRYLLCFSSVVIDVTTCCTIYPLVCLVWSAKLIKFYVAFVACRANLSPVSLCPTRARKHTHTCAHTHTLTLL